ncbi:MAG TPA: FAD-binding oxidoreductase, partial [Ignavibacteriaceae bacterium]|nr:FAD-binding oxidoreductase [Ignavibacteriaceae bacterium]
MIIKTLSDEIENYITDASNFKGNCSAVYIPEFINEVSEILKEADKSKTPVTISGNGTGLTGARVPLDGIIISTEKLNRIIEINKEEKYVIVEPGVVLDDLQKKVNEYNLLYPPDPTEWNCFIGGTVATNASGEKTFKYGPTRNFVEELQVVLADGNVVELKRGQQKGSGSELELITISGKKIFIKIPDVNMPEVKNAAGYYLKNNMDAIDLFIGSEGTLGVITKIKLKLVSLPDNVLSSVIFFSSENDAISFIEEARSISFNTRKLNSDSIDALALEFMDKNCLDFLREDYPQIPFDAEASVWFEQETTSLNDEKLFNDWADLIARHNGNADTAWVAFTAKDKKKLEEFRHSASAKANEFIVRSNVGKLGTDVAVPDNSFSDFYKECKSLVIQSGLKFIAYGHFGNSHLHLNMLPLNKKEYEKGKEIYKQICIRAVELKGTISAEHGIGKLKTEYLEIMYGKKNIRL